MHGAELRGCPWRRPRSRLRPTIRRRRARARPRIARTGGDALDHLVARAPGMFDDDDVAHRRASARDRQRPVARQQRRRHARALDLDARRPPAQTCPRDDRRDDHARRDRRRTVSDLGDRVPVSRPIDEGGGCPCSKHSSSRARTVHAHCDLPCGVYDPAQARIEAESVKACQEKYQGSDDPIFKDRAVAIKEERADLVKEHLWVLWTDYFKPEHLETYPELHEQFWNATKLAGDAKRSDGPRAGPEAAGRGRRAREDLLGDEVGVATDRAREPVEGPGRVSGPGPSSFPPHRRREADGRGRRKPCPPARAPMRRRSVLRSTSTQTGTTKPAGRGGSGGTPPPPGLVRHRHRSTVAALTERRVSGRTVESRRDRRSGPVLRRLPADTFADREGHRSGRRALLREVHPLHGPDARRLARRSGQRGGRAGPRSSARRSSRRWSARRRPWPPRCASSTSRAASRALRAWRSSERPTRWRSCSGASAPTRNPAQELAEVRGELLLADLAVVECALEKAAKRAKGKGRRRGRRAAGEPKTALDAEMPLRDAGLSEEGLGTSRRSRR